VWTAHVERSRDPGESYSRARQLAPVRSLVRSPLYCATASGCGNPDAIKPTRSALGSTGLVWLPALPRLPQGSRGCFSRTPVPPAVLPRAHVRRASRQEGDRARPFVVCPPRFHDARRASETARPADVPSPPTSAFCTHHTKLLETVDVESLREGRTPKRRGVTEPKLLVRRLGVPRCYSGARGYPSSGSFTARRRNGTNSARCG
jgi:hypothetical protein